VLLPQKLSNEAVDLLRNKLITNTRKGRLYGIQELDGLCGIDKRDQLRARTMRWHCRLHQARFNSELNV